jgi:hypothetical protein
MTIERQILTDLLVSQSTADSIAGRIRTHKDAVVIILNRLATEDQVSSHELIIGTTPTGLLVWHLTPAARQALTA